MRFHELPSSVAGEIEKKLNAFVRGFSLDVRERVDDIATALSDASIPPDALTDEALRMIVEAIAEETRLIREWEEKNAS